MTAAPPEVTTWPDAEMAWVVGPLDQGAVTYCVDVFPRNVTVSADIMFAFVKTTRNTNRSVAERTPWSGVSSVPEVLVQVFRPVPVVEDHDPTLPLITLPSDLKRRKLILRSIEVDAPIAVMSICAE